MRRRNGGHGPPYHASQYVKMGKSKSSEVAEKVARHDIRGMSRILIADDDRELCALLADYLRREGFEVDTVHDGEAPLLRKTRSGAAC